ncbi:MAG TPA: ribonuclease E inhibitor RraB [Fimbriimonadaceae bacterium]|nr:ribonuclease E inhibitor RraB [Fimbriimonadaceae bacterium]
MRFALLFGLLLVVSGGCSSLPKPATERIQEREAAKAARLPKDPSDAAVFAELKKAGHNFSKETKVDFYLRFPEEGAARGALQAYSGQGYTGDVSQQQGFWACHLQRKMVLTADEIDLARFGFRDITVNNGGEYDGWGAEVVK